MKILISGGCKNGKSTLAQQLAKTQQEKEALSHLYYLATMKPSDKEDEERIVRHVMERDGMGFETVEVPVHISSILDCCDQTGSFLLDSLTALLSNEMFQNGEIHSGAHEKIQIELDRVMKNIEHMVIVSDGIFSDAILYDEYTEQFRNGLSQLERACAASCDIVIEAYFSNFIIHKGKEQYEAYF